VHLKSGSPSALGRHCRYGTIVHLQYCTSHSRSVHHSCW